MSSSPNPAAPPLEAGDITRLLIDARSGGRPEMDALFAAVYDRLKTFARQRVRGKGPASLDATALVHEAYLRFVDASRADYRDRQHFFAAAAKVMRHIVIDHARRHRALKRGAGAAVKTIGPDDVVVDVRLDDLLVIDAALDRLAEASPRLVQVVELCFFAGLTTEEAGAALGVTGRTVKREWQKARLLLRALLDPSARPSTPSPVRPVQGSADALGACYQTYRQRFGPEHPDTLQTLGNIGILYRRFGDDVKAERVYREVYEVQRRTRGDSHPRAIRAGKNLNLLLVDTGRLDEARRVARDLVRAYETIAARADADAVTLDDHATFLLDVEPRDVRDPARALTIAARAVAASGRQHYLRLKTLAQAHAALDQPQQAIVVAREALPLPGAIQSWTTEELLVDLLQKHGTPADLEAFLLHRLEQYPRLGRDNEKVSSRTMRHLARFYARQGRAEEAEQRYRDVLAQLRKTAPETDWEVGRAKSELGEQLAARRAFAEAEPLLITGFETLLGDTGVRTEVCNLARTRLVTLYEHWNRPQDAQRWRGRAIR